MEVAPLRTEKVCRFRIRKPGPLPSLNQRLNEPNISWQLRQIVNITDVQHVTLVEVGAGTVRGRIVRVYKGRVGTVEESSIECP